MAKSKNHTNHNQNRKAHRNGIKKPKKNRYNSTKGVSNCQQCLAWPPCKPQALGHPHLLPHGLLGERDLQPSIVRSISRLILLSLSLSQTADGPQVPAQPAPRQEGHGQEGLRGVVMGL